MKNKKTMIDPPVGSKYGFPKQIPETVLGNDDDKVTQWFLEQGYPQILIDQGMLNHCRIWIENKDENEV